MALTALAKRNSYVPKKKITVPIKMDTAEKEKKEWNPDSNLDQISGVSSVRNTKSVVSRGSEKYKVAGQYGHKIMQKTGIISYERRASNERGKA